MSSSKQITVPAEISEKHRLETIEEVSKWISEKPVSMNEIADYLRSRINELKDQKYLRIEQDKDAFAQMVEGFTLKCEQKDKDFADIKRENERLLAKLQNVYKPKP